MWLYTHERQSVENVSKAHSESSYFSLHQKIVEFKDIRSYLLDYSEQSLWQTENIYSVCSLGL